MFEETSPNSPPRLITTREEMAEVRPSLGEVALVATMGALHAGHRGLITAARKRTTVDTVVVSIFVNPLQFGPNEDFERYPRTLDTDLEVCRAEGVDVVFAPSVEDMYPGHVSPGASTGPGESRTGQMVRVSSGAMGAVLEGEFRPGFFDGVLTVVLKLVNLVRPDIAVFGQKDAQQLAMVRRMVRDLCLPLVVVSSPTVRDPDGLATSSRNVYLSAEERGTALSLSRALLAGADASVTGPPGILAAARDVLDAAATADPPLALDYLALVEPETFTEVAPDYRGEAILAVAARVGDTRLIDNVPLTL